MTITLSLTDDKILTAYGDFLTSILGCPVVVGQVNRVVELKGDFVVMTPLSRQRLMTNLATWGIVSPAAIDNDQHTQVQIQLDIHGPSSADNIQIITTMMRSWYAADFFNARPEAIQSLYASDPLQAPFINGEGQYEDRWVVYAVLQVNVVASTPQQFADTLAIELVEVDTTYPAGA